MMESGHNMGQPHDDIKEQLGGTKRINFFFGMRNHHLILRAFFGWWPIYIICTSCPLVGVVKQNRPLSLDGLNDALKDDMPPMDPEMLWSGWDLFVGFYGLQSSNKTSKGWCPLFFWSVIYGLAFVGLLAVFMCRASGHARNHFLPLWVQPGKLPGETATSFDSYDFYI